MLSTEIARDEISQPAARCTGLLPTSGVFRILVCRPTHSLGNSLLLTPLLQELQTVYPGAEIDIVTRTPIGADIFGRFSSVRRVLRLPSWAFAHPVQFLSVLSEICKSSYDLVVDPHSRSRTGRALLRLSRASYKLGFSECKDSALSHAISLPAQLRHTALRPVYLLRTALGKEGGAIPTLDIALTPAEKTQGQEMVCRLLDASPRRFPGGVIGVFANATGPKLLGKDWWRSFLQVLVARYPEHAVVEIVPASGRSMLGSVYPTFFSTDIRRLAGVLSQLSLFVSCDCGVMHLACAAGVPVTGVFSATDPLEWGPYGSRDKVIDARGLTPEQVAERVVVPHQ